MIIKTWMKTDLITASPDITINEAINIFLEKKVGVLPVVDQDGNFLGALRLKSIMKKFMPSYFELIYNIENLIENIEDYGEIEYPDTESKSILNKKITEIMDKNLTTVSENCSVFGAVTVMSHFKMQDLLIVNDGKLKGLVSMVDLGVAFLNWLQAKPNDTD